VCDNVATILIAKLVWDQNTNCATNQPTAQPTMPTQPTAQPTAQPTMPTQPTAQPTMPTQPAQMVEQTEPTSQPAQPVKHMQGFEMVIDYDTMMKSREGYKRGCAGFAFV
jgi:hypothetical protein